MLLDLIKSVFVKTGKMTDEIKIEFAVQISNPKCASDIRSALADVGEIDIDMDKGSVLVTTTVPWIEIQNKIEATGRRAVLSGFGGQSAVSIVNHGNEKTNVKGVVRFCATGGNQATNSIGAVVDGAIDGLDSNRRYKVNIHECGDISDGCASVGDVYDSREIDSDDTGRATIRYVRDKLSIPDIIGRAVVIAEADSDRRLACGIIARSASIFENYKKICACDGVTIWDEREKPLAGSGRRTAP
ncbi:copper chaperone for superoxide dismutase isoform X2 [Uranotaenia lowii]|uniref:copper chaperone for superoxide dismutase isoform X2 n=1 Tax=Uranotaenia lowii TaxID=190385 RepID=UPI0024796BB2|nr:copper chaperone for superoxide dismutase isoform X2 [Uranotaenia lowii]